jgi:hypothetical protein
LCSLCEGSLADQIAEVLCLDILPWGGVLGWWSFTGTCTTPGKVPSQA